MARKNRFYQLSFALLIVSLLFIGRIRQVSASSCDEQYRCDNIDKDNDLEDYNTCIVEQKNCWESKIAEGQAEANTLQSTIDVLNGQIRLQSIKIQQTIYEIETLEREITELSQRIVGLGVSLNKLSGILIARIRESYKQSRRQFKVNFFASDSFN